MPKLIPIDKHSLTKNDAGKWYFAHLKHRKQYFVGKLEFSGSVDCEIKIIRDINYGLIYIVHSDVDLFEVQ